MLKSPIKLAQEPLCIPVTVPNGSTDVVGTPAVQSHRRIYFAAGDVTVSPTNTITLTDHGIEDGEPVTFVGASLPSGIVAGLTYWAEVVDSNTIRLWSDAPGGTTVTISSQGSGTHMIRIHRRAKYAILVNYGTTDCVIMPCQDASDSISDSDEWPIIGANVCQPFPLDITGFKALAFYGLGGGTTVRVVPLENY